MRVKELQSALLEIRDVFAAAGASAAERDLEAVLSLLADKSDKDLASYLADVRGALGGSPQPAAQPSELAERLKAAAFDEERFRQVLGELAANRALGKAEMQEVAKRYGVIRLNARSRASLLESIERHFYWMLINRDADAMAKRATPW